MGDILDLPSRPDSGPDGRSLTSLEDIVRDLPMILRTAAASATWAGASAYDAQDIAQGLVLELYTAALRGKLPHEPRAWARAAAKRQAWALAKRRPREMLIPPDSHVLGDAAGHDIAEGIAEQDQVLRWISRLPEEQQAVIALIMDGFGLTEIAHHLKISPQRARDRLRAARMALRTVFVDQLEEDQRVETARQDEFARGRGPASRPQAADPASREDTDLAALPPRQQEVLRLSRHGYKPAQIARALAISPNTVRVNLFHARKRIRQHAGAA